MRESTKALLRPLYRRFGGPRLRDAANVLAGTAAPLRLDASQLLHDLRSQMLREMPRVDGAPVAVMLSAGCAGRWYFDWIAERYGTVQRHIGIEYYTPQPPDLPANVEWIANTCSDMSGVTASSCDLIFSGQNVEHLWPEEVAGFLIEAARVTRPGGWLVMDSPNRLMTAPQNWSHPEHTVELTLAEIVELIEMAGFTITKQTGLWLCRDATTATILPFDPNLPAAGWSVPERIIAALDHPADAFLWWVEARRTEAEPDAAAIRARIDAIFAAAWPERVQRLIALPGLLREEPADAAWIAVPAAQTGAVMFGPYMPLRAGNYRVTFNLETEGDAAGVATFDVIAENGNTVLAQGGQAGADGTAVLSFSLDRLVFGVQFRCIATGRGAFRLRHGVQLEETLR